MDNGRRRVLKQWELDLLWSKSRGRCTICNHKLTRAHADHTVPFVETGRTNVYEMQNLCEACNLKKGVLSMQEAIQKLRKFEPDLTGYRDDQRQLHAVILKAIESGETEIGVYFHIRGGKSMLQRMLSVHLSELRLCAVSLAVNNRSELRRQITLPEDWLEDFDRLNTIAPREPPYGVAHVRYKNTGEEISGFWPDVPWANNEYLLSTTIQTICSRLNRVIPWIQSVNNRTGLPVLVCLDECQNFGIDEGGGEEVESRDWAPAIKRLQSETKIILIALSGYPHRQDGLCLPGFVPLNKEEEERQKWIRGKVIEEIDERRKLVEMKLTKYVKQSFTMAPRGGADFIIGMERGFNSGALCGLHQHPISHKITYKEDGKIVLDNQSLADLDEATARRVLGVYLWDDTVIDACVREFVELLTQKRRAEKSLKGLIYSMMDTAARGEDGHAHKIRAALQRIAPHLKVRIVTMHTDKSPADALLAFNNNDFDVLILKNVGRVGFNCPCAKVLLDLSTVRTECMVAQTWLRVATPYKGIPGEIITPSDITSTELYKKIVKHNGGDKMSRASDAQIIDENEVITETADRSVIVGEQETMGVITHDLREVPPEECRLVDVYLDEHPGYNDFIQHMNMPARVDFVHLQMRDHGWTPPSNFAQAKPTPPPPARRFTEAHRYRTPINKAWHKAVNKKFGLFSRSHLDDEAKKEWNDHYAQLGYEAKRRAGEPRDRRLDQIQSLDALEIILTFFEELGR
jgi:hypothetical protein